MERLYIPAKSASSTNPKRITSLSPPYLSKISTNGLFSGWFLSKSVEVAFFPTITTGIFVIDVSYIKNKFFRKRILFLYRIQEVFIFYRPENFPIPKIYWKDFFLGDS